MGWVPGLKCRLAGSRKSQTKEDKAARPSRAVKRRDENAGYHGPREVDGVARSMEFRQPSLSAMERSASRSRPFSYSSPMCASTIVNSSSATWISRAFLTLACSLMPSIVASVRL